MGAAAPNKKKILIPNMIIGILIMVFNFSVLTGSCIVPNCLRTHRFQVTRSLLPRKAQLRSGNLCKIPVLIISAWLKL